MGLFFYAAPLDATTNATRCNGLPDGASHGDYANVSLAGAIHGRVYRCAPSNTTMGFGGITWSGCRNFPTSTNDRSFVVRLKPVYDGFPDVAASTIFSFQGTGFYPKINTLVFHHWTDGHFRVTVYSGNTLGNDQFQITSTPVSFSRGVSYDLVVTWNSTGTGGFNVYVDGTQVVTNAAVGQNFLSVTQPATIGSISLGIGGLFINNSGYLIEEFAIYDEIISATPFTGASRTTPISTTPFLGISFPTEAKVLAPTTWNEYGTAKTGTLTLPTASQVKDTVVYGEGGNSLTGNVTLPLANEVEAGVTYGANDTEFVGNLDTGSIDPGVNNVLQGVNYEILGTPLTGTYKPVSANNVKINVTFGPNASLTGTYNPLSNTVGYYRRPNPSSEFFAPIETQKALYQYLSNDEQLNELLGGSSSQKIFDHVPDNVPYPYVTFLALPFTPRDNHTYDGLECEFQVNVHYQPGTSKTSARGNLPVQLVQFRIDQLLHNVELCIEGWNTLQCRRTFITIETEDDNVTKQGIQRFKLYLGSKF